jgi:hypothetical protein
MLEQSHQQRAGDALSSGEESEQKIPSGSCSYDTMESHRVPSARTDRNNGVFNRHYANYPLTSIPVSPPHVLWRLHLHVAAEKSSYCRT